MRSGPALEGLAGFVLALGATLFVAGGASPAAPSGPDPASEVESPRARPVSERCADLRRRIEAVEKELAPLESPQAAPNPLFEDPYLANLAGACLEVNLKVHVGFAEQRFGLDPVQSATFRDRARRYLESRPFAAYGHGGLGSEFLHEMLAPLLTSAQFEKYRAWEEERTRGLSLSERGRIQASARIHAGLAGEIHSILVQEGHASTYEVVSTLTDLESAQSAVAREAGALERARARFSPLLTDAQRQGLDLHLDQNLDRLRLFVAEFEAARSR